MKFVMVGLFDAVGWKRIKGRRENGCGEY